MRPVRRAPRRCSGDRPRPGGRRDPPRPRPGSRRARLHHPRAPARSAHPGVGRWLLRPRRPQGDRRHGAAPRAGAPARRRDGPARSTRRPRSPIPTAGPGSTRNWSPSRPRPAASPARPCPTSTTSRAASRTRHRATPTRSSRRRRHASRSSCQATPHWRTDSLTGMHVSSCRSIAYRAWSTGWSPVSATRPPPISAFPTARTCGCRW